VSDNDIPWALRPGQELPKSPELCGDKMHGRICTKHKGHEGQGDPLHYDILLPEVMSEDRSTWCPKCGGPGGVFQHCDGPIHQPFRERAAAQKTAPSKMCWGFVSVNAVSLCVLEQAHQGPCKAPAHWDATGRPRTKEEQTARGSLNLPPGSDVEPGTARGKCDVSKGPCACGATH
jgi:hypothetical protein